MLRYTIIVRSLHNMVRRTTISTGQYAWSIEWDIGVDLEASDIKVKLNRASALYISKIEGDIDNVKGFAVAFGRFLKDHALEDLRVIYRA